MITIDAALRDPKVLGAALGEPATWATWLTTLKAGFGIAFRRVSPVALDRIPAVAESFLISVSILRDDAGDPFWIGQRDAQPGWHATDCAQLDRVTNRSRRGLSQFSGVTPSVWSRS
jgi:hypothetical protein